MSKKQELAEPMPERDAYSFSQMLDTGVLWLINTTVFHPRGLALALDFGDGETEPRGWSLIFAGEGEPWMFKNDDPTINERFQAVTALMAQACADGRAPQLGETE